MGFDNTTPPSKSRTDELELRIGPSWWEDQEDAAYQDPASSLQPSPHGGGMMREVGTIFRKSLVSVNFLSAILGPEMAAPILWAPGKMRSFCRKTSMPVKYFGFFGGGGGGRADFIFLIGARIFLTFSELAL